jgi:hypothetical protein
MGAELVGDVAKLLAGFGGRGAVKIWRIAPDTNVCWRG